jgi:CelD/BcsL family acetyltransferase involved in cellulose biosynthesis
MRTKVRSQRPQFECSFSADISTCNDPAHLGTILDSLFALHGERWNLKNQAGVFNSAAKRQFYLEMAERFLSHGWLRLYSLRADGAYAAHQFCLEYKSRMFLLQEGFSPTLIDHSIGNVLRTYVLEDCIARKLHVYDFLSGVSAHKLSWGAKEKTSVRVAASPRSIKGFVHFGVEDAVLEIKSALRRMLPPQAIDALKRIRVAMQRQEARPSMSPLAPPATSDTTPAGKH